MPSFTAMACFPPAPFGAADLHASTTAGRVLDNVGLLCAPDMDDVIERFDPDRSR